MQQMMSNIGAVWRRFAADDRGTASLEFVIIFPVFFSFFLMTFESGIISLRHVMLERGVDIAVRDVRIGAQTSPTRDTFRERICDAALIIEDCINQMEIELLSRDPHAWNDVPNEVQCVDRGDMTIDNSQIDDLANNQLMFIRACVRIDPFFPISNIGRTRVASIGQAIVDNNSGNAAAGSHALVSMSAFVVEPYMLEVE
jgi:hypothetical protein